MHGLMFHDSTQKSTHIVYERRRCHKMKSNRKLKLELYKVKENLASKQKIPCCQLKP